MCCWNRREGIVINRLRYWSSTPILILDQSLRLILTREKSLPSIVDIWFAYFLSECAFQMWLSTQSSIIYTTWVLAEFQKTIFKKLIMLVRDFNLKVFNLRVNNDWAFIMGTKVSVPFYKKILISIYIKNWIVNVKLFAFILPLNSLLIALRCVPFKLIVIYFQ